MTEPPTKVELHQFPPIATVRNISPFCLKVEMFLRINNIPYDNYFKVKERSKYGLLPYIVLNGEHIADSAIIIERLKEHFKIEEPLSQYEKGVARTIDRMLDQHTFFLIYKHKIQEDPKRFVSILPIEDQAPKALMPLLRAHLARVFKKSITKRIRFGLGPFSDEEFLMLLRKDLEAINNILGTKQFLFGDILTSADCTLFGHICGIYYLPFETEVKKILDNEFPIIIEYTKRVRDRVFPTDFTFDKQ